MVHNSNISSVKYQLQKDFVKETMRKLANESSQFNAAIVMYNHRAAVELNLTRTSQLDHFLDVMDNLPFLEDFPLSLPRIDRALQITSDFIFPRQQGRKVPKIAILLTQGAPSFVLEQFPLRNGSDALKEKGVRILVVCIGHDASRKELLNITEEMGDLILVNGFSSLSKYEDNLVAKICSAAGKARR